MDPFEVSLGKFTIFQQKKESVAVLVPSPDTPLHALQTAVSDILSIGVPSFTFHLTVGQFAEYKVSLFFFFSLAQCGSPFRDPRQDAEAHTWLVRRDWKDVSFRVDHLDIIARDSAGTPFTIRRQIPFGDKNGNTSLAFPSFFSPISSSLPPPPPPSDSY